MRKLAVLLLLLVPALAPLTYPGFFETRSTFVPLYRLAEMSASFPRMGWRAVWNPLGERGILAYLLAWAFCKAGLAPLAALKLLLGLSLLAAGMGAYVWTRPRLGDLGAMLAATLYVYAPVSLAALYVRGSPGEVLGIGILPWLFAAVEALSRRRHETALAGTACVLLLAALTMSHPGLGLPAAALSIAYLAWQRRWVPAAATLLASIGALWLTRYLNPVPPTPDFFEHFALPHQLFSAWWGVHPGTPGWLWDVPLQLGVAAMTLAFFTLAYWLSERDGYTGFWLAATAGCILMSLGLSATLWRLTGAWRLLDYPWQTLSVAGLGLAVLGGSLIRYEPRLKSLPLWAAVMALVLLSGYRYLEPKFVKSPRLERPLAVIGADNAILVDCAIEGEPRPGEEFTLRLLWQAVRPFDADYTVFVHLLDQTGAKQGQRDQMPLNGEAPTSKWLPGRLLEDEYRIPVAENAPVGPFTLAIGMYRWDTGRRLPVRGRDDGMALIPLELCPQERSGGTDAPTPGGAPRKAP